MQPLSPQSRRRIAGAILVGLIVFFLASLYRLSVAREGDIAALKREVSGLRSDNAALRESVVAKLAEILTPVIRNEVAALEAGRTPTVRVEDVLAKVRGIDQSIIDEAVRRAQRNAAVGPAGPPGPAGPSGTSPTTTGASPTTTTDPTVRPSTTTTRGPPPTSTTTTRPCSVGLLGFCLI